MNALGEYASYQDLGRLEYVRLLRAKPSTRARLPRYWTSPEDPHHRLARELPCSRRA